MNNNRWLSLILLIGLLIAGIVGAGYLLFRQNQSEIDKEAALKRIQTYIIEKDHRSAYDLADSLAARYPDDENLISLRKALSELIGESNPFETALSNTELTDRGLNNFDLEVIEPITPRPDRSQDIVKSSELPKATEEKKPLYRQEVPPIREEDIQSRSLLNGLSQEEISKNNSQNTSPAITAVPRPDKGTASKKSVSPTPLSATQSESVAPDIKYSSVKPSQNLKPSKSAPSHLKEAPPVRSKNELHRAEEYLVRVRLFEALDAVQTGNLNNAKTKIDGLLNSGSAEPSFKSVSNLLDKGKQKEARERLENLLGSIIVFPSVDQEGKQSSNQRLKAMSKSDKAQVEKLNKSAPDNFLSDHMNSAGKKRSAPTSPLDISKIQAMNLENPDERANAKEQLENYLKGNPNDSDATGLLASIADSEGDIDKAISLYEQAVAISPKAEDYFSLGGLYFHKRDYNKSSNAYNQSINLDPKNTRSYNNLGINYVMLEQDTKAIDSFSKAISNDPQYANGYYQLGRVYKRNGNLDSALLNFQKAYELENNRLNYIAELANTNLEKGNFIQADDLYTQALLYEPNNEVLLYNASQAKNALKQYASGLALIEKALKFSPSNLSYRLIKADILDLMGNKVEAEAEYKAIADTDPSDVLSRINLGSLYTSQKKYAEAKVILEQAEALAPDNGATQNNLGAMLIDQKQFGAAIPYLKKASDLGVREAEYNLGLAYFEEKQDAKAKAIFDKILQENPDNWDILYLSGLLDYRMSNKQSGKRKFQKILQRNPNFNKKSEIERLLNNQG